MNHEKVLGIDIGTSSIKMVLTDNSHENERPHILVAMESPSHGFRHGYVNDVELASESLGRALAKFEKLTQEKVEAARFSIGGAGLDSQYIKTSITIPKKESEITESHIMALVQKAEDLFIEKYPNKKVLHLIPLRYSVDGRDVLGDPIGLFGSEIQVRIIFITIPEHHYESLVSVIKKNDILIDEILALPVADARASLGYQQKNQGVLLTNIGSETSSLVSFENGDLSSLKVFSIGSNDITNDIALGFQIPLEEAETIKRDPQKSTYPKRKFDEIIVSRLTDIFELTELHLKSIRKNRLLPAGNIFSGGGSELAFLEEYAKKYLKLPAHSVSFTQVSKKTKKEKKIGPQFSVAYGLCFNDRRSQRKKKFNFRRLKRMILKKINELKP